MVDVALQVFAYDEAEAGAGVEATLDAYAAQPVPAWADVTYEACVTPASTGGGDRDRTVEQAAAHPVFEYVEMPAGKLSSRNAAHEAAVGRGADVIVSADADAPPLGEDALGARLEPLGEDGVVATNSRPTSPPTPLGIAVNLAAWAEDVAFPHVNGQLHALTAGGWRAAGPFDVGVDERSVQAVRAEEEHRFRQRLEAVGEVRDVPGARVYNDTRRTRCRLRRSLGLSTSDYCDRHGVTTFHPTHTRHTRTRTVLDRDVVAGPMQHAAQRYQDSARMTSVRSRQTIEIAGREVDQRLVFGAAIALVLLAAVLAMRGGESQGFRITDVG